MCGFSSQWRLRQTQPVALQSRAMEEALLAYLDLALAKLQTLVPLINDAKDSVNSACSQFQPYQLILASVAFTLVTVYLVDFVKSLADPRQPGIRAKLFRCLISLPFIRGIARKELNKAAKGIQDELAKPYQEMSFVTELPQNSQSVDEILNSVTQYQGLSTVDWTGGRVSGGLYAPLKDQSLMQLMNFVFSKTAYTNPLHADVFPGIRKMEAEIVRMTCSLYSGDDKTCGTVTTGGTESIVMACKAYRDYAYHVKGITKPQMVVPVTAHAAFDKAAELLSIRIQHIPMDVKTGKVNVKKMSKAITSNTIMLVASSPNFPHGIIDPVKEIAKIGLKYNIPVHVDACLGGFLVPFLREAGFTDVEIADFSVPGVTSISADTHKYAYAPKGSSVVMYKEPKYRHFQYSICTDWPGGVYASPTISGSRAGANIAVCWAAMMYHGRSGYVKATKAIVQLARDFKAKCSSLEGLKIIGDPLMSVLAFTSDRFNILQMSENLSKRGWNLNTLQYPAGFHICFTQMHLTPGVTDQLFEDIKAISKQLLKEPKTELTGQAAVYGMAAMLPDRRLIADIAKTYLDSCYSTAN